MENPAIFKARSFLVVDDDPIIRADISAIVRDCGFEAWEAANTTEALSLLGAAPETFAALITDIQMPGTRSGAVLANHARAMWPHITIIVITGGRMPMPGELPYQARLLPKPISVPLLATMIQGAV
ncbi:MAG: response regulator [Devosia sp.]|uniref:response regulator n=1 Tax=Devosia sp. TaxID=1871048 RepID=UPI00339981AD